LGEEKTENAAGEAHFIIQVFVTLSEAKHLALWPDGFFLTGTRIFAFALLPLTLISHHIHRD